MECRVKDQQAHLRICGGIFGVMEVDPSLPSFAKLMAVAVDFSSNEE
jgi:hypothetical protein